MNRRQTTPGRAALTWVVWLFLWATAASAAAQNVTEQTRYTSFVFSEHHRAKVEPLLSLADAELERLGRLFGHAEGVLASPRIQVIVAPNAAEFARAQPGRASFDTWMAGTAYPSLDLVVLSLESDKVFEIEEIFRHELSHVALYRAAGRQRLPRWLDEGIAMFVTGEGAGDRLRTAAGAAFSGALVPVDKLDAVFHDDAARVHVAYAQSALFTRWLVRKHGLIEKLPHILAAVRAQKAPLTTTEAVLGQPLTALDATWRAEVEAGWGWVSLLGDASMLWSAAGVVFVIALFAAYRRKRAAFRKRRASEEEEVWPPTPLPVGRPRTADDDWAS
jgi:hypothetical protein